MALLNQPDNEGGIQHCHLRFVNIENGVAMLTDRDKRKLVLTRYLLTG
jgi:hypothetical protein